MGISFNNWVRRSGDVRARTAGAVGASKFYQSVFDYFSDAPSVNDCLFLAASRISNYTGDTPYSGVRLTIGTPRTNAGAGLWEYSGPNTLCDYTAGNSTFHTNGYPLVTGDVLELGYQGTLPSPLQKMSTNTLYFARSLGGNYFSIHATAADAAAGVNAIVPATSGSNMYAQVWRPLSCVDNTQGLTATGERTVEFDPPDDWYCINYIGYANDSFNFYIRYRLTDVSGITEGGANSTTAIYGRDFCYTVDGYSQSSPCTFSALADWDAAYGPGLITRRSERLYELRAGLVIGNGTNACWFSDADKMVIMGGGILLSSYGNLKLGELIDGKYPVTGCTVVSMHPELPRFFSHSFASANAGLFLYGCAFREHDYVETWGNGTHHDILNCHLGSPNSSFAFGGDQTIRRVTMAGHTEGFRLTSAPTGTIEDVLLYNTVNGVYWAFTSEFPDGQMRDVDFRNLTFAGSPTRSFYMPGWSYAVKNASFNLIDCVGFDCSKCSINTPGTYSNIAVREKYTVALTVRDHLGAPLSGAVVRVANGIGTWSGTTGADGKVSLLPVVKQYLWDTKTFTDGGASSVTVEREGYLPYRVSGMVIDRRQSGTVRLEPYFGTRDFVGGCV